MKTNDTVAALDKRINRGQLARWVEQRGVWRTYNSYTAEYILKNPAAQTFALLAWTMCPTMFLSICVYGESNQNPFLDGVWIYAAASGLFTLLMLIFVIAPLAVRLMYPMPLNGLTDTQAQAVKTYESMSPEDRRACRPAFVEFISVERSLQHTKYEHRERVWHRTVDAIEKQHVLEHKIELASPSEGENTLATLIARNVEMKQELKEITTL